MPITTPGMTHEQSTTDRTNTVPGSRRARAPLHRERDQEPEDELTDDAEHDEDARDPQDLSGSTGSPSASLYVFNVYA